MRNTIIFVLFAVLTGIFGYFYSSPKVVQKIIVVRHAEAYKNLAKIPENAEADSLTTLGEKQAKALGKILENERIDLWISSTKKRAMQTRDIAFAQNNHGGEKVTSQAFLSMKKGGKSWQWRTQNWKEGKDPRPTEGESLSDATKRCLQKLSEYKTTKTIIIFSHGDICATLIGHAKQTTMYQRYEKHALPLAGYAKIHVLINGQWYTP
ncbi:histidine phosphatase family protein [Candidatus Uabimicrobium amorphum]|uniref:Phosphoglycerate mutase n=1 Tax=Uabimicrobium amorphum TaxID=2596890 RepID=A0A5S9IRR1_UABAM|nr:phosphoglycerate mutase family protein [Candidatus Uabimicrobium amorphum]BBM86694.1 phosphoglycerate mutase [Candidatus Uabimicrobium amorphum]